MNGSKYPVAGMAVDVDDDESSSGSNLAPVSPSKGMGVGLLLDKGPYP